MAEATSIEARKAELAVKEKEALDVIKADLAQWLTEILGDGITEEYFMKDLQSAVPLCRLACLMQKAAKKQTSAPKSVNIPQTDILFDVSAAKNFVKFRAMSNAANFIGWCKQVGGVHVVFESEGLVEHTDERGVILCLLDLARVAKTLGMAVPKLVKMEDEIDKGKELEKEEEEHSRDANPPSAKRRKNETFYDRVLHLLLQCNCKNKLKAVNHGNGKFQIITSHHKVTIYLKVLSDRVMVRVGGGWDTLEHFLIKHDPCRVGLTVRASDFTPPSTPKPLRSTSLGHKTVLSQAPPRHSKTPTGNRKRKQQN